MSNSKINLNRNHYLKYIDSSNVTIENKIESLSNKNRSEIIENHKVQLNDTLNILNVIKELDLSSATKIYNLLFSVELFLKYFLFIYSKITINDIDKLGHDINKLLAHVLLQDMENKNNGLNYYGNINFEKLQDLLSKFKTKKGKQIDLSKYANFKYNRDKGVIFYFNSEVNNTHKKIIEEVIKWLNSNIQNL